MRKITIHAIIILVVLMLAACDTVNEAPVTEPATTVSASVTEESDFVYVEKTDGTLVLKKYNGSETMVSIPAEYNGKKVTTVAAFAFENNTTVTEVTFSDGVTTVEDCAFAGCTALEKIVLPESVTVISKESFADTPWYKSFPDGFISINGTVLEYKNLPENTASLEIPDGTVRIGARAFYGLGIKSANLPDTVTAVGERAFNKCTMLMKLRMPSGLSEIGYAAFHDTAWFKMQSGAVVIGDILVGYKSESTAAIVPPRVKTIAPGAFLGCEAIAITIPNGIANVCDYAFSGCTQLMKITLPESVSYIGEHAFDLCTTLQSISVSDNNPVYTVKDGVLYLKNDGRELFRPVAE